MDTFNGAIGALTDAGADANGHGNGRSPQDFTPPTTRQEADQAILTLSNDIGLILAQLAEDQVAWCTRTGRSPADYAGWRRRALFAKVHKESQLRECKRVRAQLLGANADVPATGHMAEAAVAGVLMERCLEVVASWRATGGETANQAVHSALARLAESLDELGLTDKRGSGASSPHYVDLAGVSARTMVTDMALADAASAGD